MAVGEAGVTAATLTSHQCWTDIYRRDWCARSEPGRDGPRLPHWPVSPLFSTVVLSGHCFFTVATKTPGIEVVFLTFSPKRNTVTWLNRGAGVRWQYAERLRCRVYPDYYISILAADGGHTAFVSTVSGLFWGSLLAPGGRLWWVDFTSTAVGFWLILSWN